MPVRTSACTRTSSQMSQTLHTLYGPFGGGGSGRLARWRSSCSCSTAAAAMRRGRRRRSCSPSSPRPRPSPRRFMTPPSPPSPFNSPLLSQHAPLAIPLRSSVLPLFRLLARLSLRRRVSSPRVPGMVDLSNPFFPSPLLKCMFRLPSLTAPLQVGAIGFAEAMVAFTRQVCVRSKGSGERQGAPEERRPITHPVGQKGARRAPSRRAPSRALYLAFAIELKSPFFLPAPSPPLPPLSPGWAATACFLRTCRLRP